MSQYSSQPKTAARPGVALAARQGSRRATAATVTSAHRNNLPLDHASRLLSETAHDLRTPLCAIRESARLVNDGYLGPITAEQRSCLDGVFEQCEAMEQLIADMMSLEQLRSGAPQVYRRWVDPLQIVRSVTQTATPALARCDLSLVWDRPESLPEVYADPAKTSRLLLNLIGNAAQVLPGGEQVLVRLEAVAASGMLRVTVADHGPGMDLSAIDAFSQRGVSGTGGSGLGLAISRQMAALHFSTLEITSCRGVGTQVAFELPAAGPASVADAWVRWRSQFVQPPKVTPRRSAAAAAEAMPNVRLDPPSSPPAEPPHSHGRTAAMVALLPDGTPPRNRHCAVAVGIRLGETVASRIAEQVEQRLQDSTQLYELAFRTDQRRWVLLLDADLRQARQRIDDLKKQWSASLPTARLSWTELLELPIGSRSCRASVRDLLVRGSLVAPASIPAADYQMVRGGGALPAVSQIATRRLDDELRRLALHVGQQGRRLQHQAAKSRLPGSPRSS